MSWQSSVVLRKVDARLRLAEAAVRNVSLRFVVELRQGLRVGHVVTRDTGGQLAAPRVLLVLVLHLDALADEVARLLSLLVDEDSEPDSNGEDDVLPEFEDLLD